VGAVEAHGTGTPLGDPVEAAALRRVFGDGTVVAAAKARFGHLEAGAGAVGLVAAALYAHRGAVARRAVDGGLVSAAVLRAAPGLDFPGAAPSLKPLAAGALVGVSSFGFAGSVAHAVLRRPAAATARPRDAAFDVVDEVAAAAPPVAVATPAPVVAASTTSTAPADVVAAVWAALARVGVAGSGDVAADVFDLGVDSLGLAEVVGALEEAYGEGCVSVDEVFDNSTVADIAAAVARGATTTGAVVVAKAPPPKAAEAVLPKRAPTPTVEAKVETAAVVVRGGGRRGLKSQDRPPPGRERAAPGQRCGTRGAVRGGGGGATGGDDDDRRRNLVSTFEINPRHAAIGGRVRIYQTGLTPPRRAPSPWPRASA